MQLSYTTELPSWKGELQSAPVNLPSSRLRQSSVSQEGSVVTEGHHTESPPPSLRCRGVQGGPYKSTPGP